MTYTPSLKPNTRIDVADILRGIAIGGIVLIHFIEHLNFYLFPEPSSDFMAALNRGVWDTTFFSVGGKDVRHILDALWSEFLYSARQSGTVRCRFSPAFSVAYGAADALRTLRPALL